MNSTTKRLKLLKKLLEILDNFLIPFHQSNFFLITQFLSPKLSAFFTCFLVASIFDISAIFTLKFIFVNLLKSLVTINLLVSGFFLLTPSRFCF